MTAYPTSSSIRPIYHAQNFNVCALPSGLPIGFNVTKLAADGSAVEIYEVNAIGQWEDLINGGTITSTAIYGNVILTTPTSYAIEV